MLLPTHALKNDFDRMPQQIRQPGRCFRTSLDASQATLRRPFPARCSVARRRPLSAFLRRATLDCFATVCLALVLLRRIDLPFFFVILAMLSFSIPRLVCSAQNESLLLKQNIVAEHELTLR